MTTKGTTGQADRDRLAGAGDRPVGGAGERGNQGRASAGAGAAGALGAGARVQALPEFASSTDLQEVQALRMVAAAPAELTPDALARALAVLTAEIVGALAPVDRSAVLERITNRLDGHARRCRGDAAAMLGAIGAALMVMEN